MTGAASAAVARQRPRESSPPPRSSCPPPSVRPPFSSSTAASAASPSSPRWCRRDRTRASFTPPTTRASHMGGCRRKRWWPASWRSCSGCCSASRRTSSWWRAIRLPPGAARLAGTVRTPFVGTVPAIKPAAERSLTRHVAVLATPGTVKRDYTQELIRSFAGDCRVTLVGSTSWQGWPKRICGARRRPTPRSPPRSRRAFR